MMICAALMAGVLAFADTEVVTLKDLRAKDILYLPTVRSQHELTFTKPNTWKLSGNSYIEVTFQHSLELLPNRSWLQVILNDKVIKHIALTKENAKATTLKIPLPVALLQDFNKLAFRVEQHYTDYCEDPLDPSLWTQVLSTSKLVFDYTPVLPETDLARYPYPVIDPLAYGDYKVQYVFPEKPTTRELLALAHVNTHLAQAATHQHQLISTVTTPKGARTANEHIILIGTPVMNPAMLAYRNSYQGYTLDRGQWVEEQTGQVVGDGVGLLFFFPNPENPNRSVVVVTGNNDAGVLQAAQYLTTRPVELEMAGQAMQVAANWSQPDRQPITPPRYLEMESRTLADLGYPIQSVEKINAPPIIYDIPVMADYQHSDAKLYLDLIYSYGPGINPMFSSLELRLNDISIGSFPLLNEEKGETRKKVILPIPKELVRPQNELVAQFHLKPDKYGFCVDNYDDKAWGKIHDDSMFRVEGKAASLLPDLGLFNETGYPYNRKVNLAESHLVVPEFPTLGEIQTLLGVTSRLGRFSQPDSNIKLTLSQGNKEIPKYKNTILIRQVGDDLQVPNGFRLSWLKDSSLMPFLRQVGLMFQNRQAAQLKSFDLGHGAYLEQYPSSDNAVVTVLTAMGEDGFRELSNIMSLDKRFELIRSGFIQQVVLMDGEMTAVGEQKFPVEKEIPWYLGLMKYLTVANLLWVAGGLLVVLVVLPLGVRRLMNRK